MIDTTGQPVSLRISVTDRCQLRCFYCMPARGIPTTSCATILRLEEIARFVELVRDRFPLEKVHITGGEPLVRKNLVALVGRLARLGVAQIALTTNGQLLASAARELKDAGLHRVNVSLDSLDPDTYRRICRTGHPGDTLAGLHAARDAGLGPVKTNTVVLRNLNEAEILPIARFALANNFTPRFLELMPIAHARPFFARRHLPADEIRRHLEAAFRLDPAAYQPGASSRYYHARGPTGPAGLVGIIASETRPFCSGCRRLRLTSTGQLIACLAQGQGVDIRPLLQSADPDAPARLQDLIAQTLAAKTPRHTFKATQPMASVGG